MEVHLTEQFKVDVNKLKKQNPKLLAKLWGLIIDIDNNSENHLAGMGRPEKLKGGKYRQSRPLNIAHKGP